MPGRLKPSSIETLIREHSERFAKRLRATAREATAEEEIRIASARLISEFIEAAGLEVRGRHEYGIAGGRIDSKYGGVVLEYKNPSGSDRIGLSSTARGTRLVVKQISDRFTAFSAEENVEPTRLLGVGCDGQNIVFVRFRGGNVVVDDVQPVSPYSIELLLRALISLQATAQSFTPENLRRDFGSESTTARDGIVGLYNVITNLKSPKAKTFFEQWRILFGEVCGYDVSTSSREINELSNHYGIKKPNPAALLFSVHSYYAIFMKFLAAEIASSFSPLAITALRRCLSAPTSAALSREMIRLEQGGIWNEVGITNFLEGDLFAWYLAEWDEEIAQVIRGIVLALGQYDATTLSVDPTDSRDLLKHLYQHLFPRRVRHDLGEYYTPDWLADHVLDRSGYDGDPRKRLLDPACGSGTFLVMAINRAKRWFSEHRDQAGFGESEFVRLILNNIVGFDLNPLAVMAARVNFLLAIRDLVRSSDPFELPIYLCDSVMTPAEYGSLFVQGRRLKTAVGDIVIPSEVTTSRGILSKWAEIIELAIQDDYSTDEFLTRCTSDGVPTQERDLHRAVFERLTTLNKEGRNGIWARIIRNAFAPLFEDRFDFLIGNPPWINWESLPKAYRDDLVEVWKRYGLFNLSASAGRLGGGKKDLSMLFVYVGVHKFLRDGGTLGFVITQTVFKTKGAGEGFRRLFFDEDPPGGGRVWIAPALVDDISAVNVFDGASNRTAVFIAHKRRKKFQYPVRYEMWRGPSRISSDVSRTTVQGLTSRTVMHALPIERGNDMSPWLSLPKPLLDVAQNAIGKSPYRAMAGCTTWLNGVYWLKVINNLDEKLVLVENLHDIGRTEGIAKETTKIERDLVFPLLRGRDVSSWKATPSISILIPQDPTTRKGYSDTDMKRRWPNAFRFLKKFEAELRERSGYRKYFDPSDPFYSIYNFSGQTLAQFKVVWADMGADIQAAVVSAKTPICPEHHVMFVPTDTEAEAHYICGILMSSAARAVIAGYTTTTGKSTHVVDVLNIPRFRQTEKTHAKISAASSACHEAAARGNAKGMATSELALDRAVLPLWGVDPVRAEEIRSQFARLLDVRNIEP
jgi:hypothetical protein